MPIYKEIKFSKGIQITIILLSIKNMKFVDKILVFYF
jgi:hypothetical protein